MVDELFVNPTPTEIRNRIDRTKRKNMRMLLRSCYLLGAARVGELCGVVSPNDDQDPNNVKGSTRKMFVYGPKGGDAKLDTFKVTELDMKKAMKLITGGITIDEAFPRIEVGLFRINIEKKKELKKLQSGVWTEPVSRLVGIPLDEEYEPWGRKLFEYFKSFDENDHVFPFTRQNAWGYITHKDPVFKGLGYPVEYYEVFKNKVLIKEVTKHQHKFKFHGLRHVRAKELFEHGFDGPDFMAYFGWSAMTQGFGQGKSQLPAMTKKYASIYENWRRYFPKLLRLYSSEN